MFLKPLIERDSPNPVSGFETIWPLPRSQTISYRNCFDVAPVGFAVVGADGMILRVNERLCDLLGYGRAELENAPLSEMLFENKAEYQTLPLSAVLSGEIKEYSTQFLCTRTGQHPRWLRCTMALANGMKTQAGFLLCVFENVTGDNANQQEFEQQRGHYRQLLALSASLPGALSIYRLLPDGSSTIEFVTGSFSALLGYQPGERGPDGEVEFFKNVHPDDLPNLLKSIGQASANTLPWRAEYRVIHPERGLIHVAETAAPERQVDGSVIWYCFVEDVTQRTHDQANLRRAAAVFENTQAAIAILDPAGRVVAVNPSFENSIGVDKKRMISGGATLHRLLRADLATYRQAVSSISSTGSWHGEALSINKNGERTPRWVVVSPVMGDTGNVINYVVSLVDISRIKQTENKLNYLVLHDSLTGLPNRLLLERSLEQQMNDMQSKGRLGAVLFIDLDRFKTVNDSLGHAAGDELLKVVSNRLLERVRGGDTVARLGGDEFVVLLANIEHVGNACKVAQDIVALIEEPVTINGQHTVHVSASVGISLFPAFSVKADELLQQADAALYAAKNGGRGSYRLYDTSLTSTASTKLETEARMRRALAREEFLLHYQPILDLQRNTVVGVEALLRWDDPERGLVPPLSFIPLAEETGFIVPLGDFVIRTACKQLKEWEDAGLKLDVLSINLSARQFQLIDLPERIASIIRETGADPKKIEFEITESTLMEQGEVALEKLRALKSLGVRLSIDDFGTGYSSLSMLRRFPIDTLKIDKSFILDVTSDKTAKQIALAIISLAKSLGLQIIAEGIEKDDQRRFATAQGCHRAQGYLFSKAIPATAVPGWIKNRLAKQRKRFRSSEPTLQVMQMEC